jgi:hypothetical protein
MNSLPSGEQRKAPLMVILRHTKKQVALIVGSQTGVNVGFYTVPTQQRMRAYPEAKRS